MDSLEGKITGQGSTKGVERRKAVPDDAETFEDAAASDDSEE